MNDIPATETFVSAKDAAVYTGKHINTIRIWIAKGIIVAERPGRRGHFSIPLSELTPACVTPDSQTERISA